MANPNDARSEFVALFSTKAHVFQINPETKNSWLQKGDRAIPISIVTSVAQSPNQTSSGEQQLRLIGTDYDNNRVLDTPLLPVTEFEKRSLGFVQWNDHTGTLHGLGFNSQGLLKEFMETFQQLKKEFFGKNTAQQLEQPAQHQVPQQRAHQQPFVSGVKPQSQAQDQPDQAEVNWSQQQRQQANLSNDGSETNGLEQKAPRHSVNNTALKQFSSNTLAHPGHQMKRHQHHQQQQPQQQQQQQQQNMFKQQHPTMSQNNLNNTATTTNGNMSLNNGNSMENGVGGNNVTTYPRSQSMFGLQGKSMNINNQKNDAMSLRSGAGGPGTPDTESSAGLFQNDWQVRDQLKYENERLKQALEESSRNSGIWQNELHTLRANIVLLTQALEDSKANVDEWTLELNCLRSENKELKLRLSALESSNNPENGNDYKKDLQKYKSYVEEVQAQLRRKENEVEELQKSMEALELKAKQQNGHADDSTSSPQYAIQKQKLEVISAKFGAKISEFVNVQKEFAQYLDRLNG